MSCQSVNCVVSACLAWSGVVLVVQAPCFKPAQPPTDLRELAGGSRLRTLSLTALLRSILRLSRPLFELDRR